MMLETRFGTRRSSCCRAREGDHSVGYCCIEQCAEVPNSLSACRIVVGYLCSLESEDDFALCFVVLELAGSLPRRIVGMVA